MNLSTPSSTRPGSAAQRPGLRLDVAEKLRLDSGTALGPFTIAYSTYGTLNAERSNAILICHALTGDQYVAEPHPITGKPGWWDILVGPGKVLDTDRYFMICPNVLGGCMGSTGPGEIDPATGKPWGLTFPVYTIADMVRAQVKLIDHLGIDQLFCVIGGSMGGMQVLEWASAYPERVFAAVPIASAARHSAQNIAFHEVGRQAIMADPDWCGGNYQEQGRNPARGLAVARMAAHITYLSEQALHRKFGRNLQDRNALTFGFDADFQVENYLRHQGISFVERFDANSYLYMTRACDYFDLAAEHGGVLANAFKGTRTRFCVISFTSDWLYPTSENREIVHALERGRRQCELRRGRDRQGPRRLPLGRAGIPRHLARVPRRLRPASRIEGGMSMDARNFTAGNAAPPELRGDLRLASEMIEPGSRVLDIGCGDGELLSYLSREKNVDGRGMELSQSGVNNCVRHGLSVIQGDADNDLADYPSDAFDYVVLSQTLQATRNPRAVLLHLARIGKRAIVSIPNFGHWRIRASLLTKGRLPKTALLPFPWYETPNIHLCTIQDFATLCADEGIRIERSISLDRWGRPYRLNPVGALANLLAEQGLFLLARK